jgi:hypothetical protein
METSWQKKPVKRKVHKEQNDERSVASKAASQKLLPATKIFIILFLPATSG